MQLQSPHTNMSMSVLKLTASDRKHSPVSLSFVVFQFCYTTIFGIYCAFLFVRTGKSPITDRDVTH